MLTETESRRFELVRRLDAAFRRALEAHQHGINPPSNYAVTLQSLAHEQERRHDADGTHWYSVLTANIHHPRWAPESREFTNWLFYIVSGLRRRHWRGWSLEQMEALLSLLEDS